MIPRSLVLLLATAPDWADATITGFGVAYLQVRPPLPSGRPGRRYQLALAMDRSGSVSVREAAIGTALPACCPERHINPDGSFCVHLHSGKPIQDTDAARLWWKSLRAFLSDQKYAERHRHWPLHSQLSHGDAAMVQLEMERIAEPLGWLEEVHIGMFQGEGWLGDRLPKIVVRKGRAYAANVRSPCPRGCRGSCGGSSGSLPTAPSSVAADESGRSLLRAECTERGNVEELIILEHRRRDLERNMMEQLRIAGVTCCRSMARCHLNE